MAASLLATRRAAIVALWQERTLQGYGGGASGFMLQERDRFRNPAGHIIRQSLPALYDALVAGEAAASAERALDDIMRMRAVQDFSAAQSVSFIFVLKDIMRDEARREGCRGADLSGLGAFERRIDEMAILAFNLFMKCRERIRNIKARELSRRTYVRARMASFRD